jgi:hypothetical protein
MEDQVNNISFLDLTMHDIENNFSNVLREVDPDSQMKINLPESPIIPGDELQFHSTPLQNNYTCMASNIDSL